MRNILVRLFHGAASVHLPLLLSLVGLVLLGHNGVAWAAASPQSPAFSPTTGFQLVENFDTLTPGALQGQNGWQATSSVTVGSDPANGANRVLAASTTDLQAYKALPAVIDNASTGTLHFRLRRTGHIDGFGGASALAAPNDWSSYETQFGAQINHAADEFVVRDGGQFDVLGNGFSDQTWYCVWLVANNASDTYQVYAQGGAFTQLTQLNAAGQTVFSFRNGGADPLRTFLTRVASNSQGTLYLDDIYIDPTSQNLAAPGNACGAAPVDTTPPAVNPSETNKSFTVSILDDTADEADETINLGLSNATNATLGTTANATLTIVDNEPTGTAPTANFAANTTNGAKPLTVNFTDQSTGSITSWAWDFGDGGTSTQQNPSHTYTSAGIYTVKLTVSNPVGVNTKNAANYIQVTDAAPAPTLVLTTRQPASAGATVALPVVYNAHDHPISSLLFSLDFDQSRLSFDPTDSDNNCLPDAIQVSSLLGAIALKCASYDATDTDGELDFTLADFAANPRPLPSGALLTVSLRVNSNVAAGTELPVTFAESSFGTRDGDVAGVTQNGSVLLTSGGLLHLPLVRR